MHLLAALISSSERYSPYNMGGEEMSAMSSSEQESVPSVTPCASPCTTPCETSLLQWRDGEGTSSPAVATAAVQMAAAAAAAAALAVVEGGRVCRRARREGGSGGRAYVCRVCERKFPRAYLLLVHERTHSPLSCPVCGKTFRRSDHLRMHRETHGDRNLIGKRRAS
ncbi:uncharacterized protein LOC143024262 [Oratosquilla oratoria]|uniref:uncharacterized protein LOC143024262 n=1 Tax=Oratosquilla oratoria TaxID=337810 RepID=UPI003F75B145